MSTATVTCTKCCETTADELCSCTCPTCGKGIECQDGIFCECAICGESGCDNPVCPCAICGKRSCPGCDGTGGPATVPSPIVKDEDHDAAIHDALVARGIEPKIVTTAEREDPAPTEVSDEDRRWSLDNPDGSIYLSFNGAGELVAKSYAPAQREVVVHKWQGAEYFPERRKITPPRDGAIARPLSEFKRQKVDWLIPGRVPYGAVTALVGDGGLGKGLLSCYWTAQLTRGELNGGPAPALLVFAEDSPEFMLKPRLDAAGADLDYVRIPEFYSDGVETGFSLPSSVFALETLVEDEGAKLVIIDPISAYLDQGKDDYKEQDVRSILRPLDELARRQGCAVIVVKHLNKGSGTNPSQRTAGSNAWRNAPRSMLLLGRDPSEPDGTLRVLAHEKCNVAEQAPSLSLEIEPILLEARNGEPEMSSARIVEVGESSYTGRDLLAIDNEDRDSETARDAVKDALLEESPLTKRDLQERTGYSKRQVERALYDLGAIGQGKPARYELPEADE